MPATTVRIAIRSLDAPWDRRLLADVLGAIGTALRENVDAAAGLAAIAVETEVADGASAGADEAPDTDPTRDTPADAGPVFKARSLREGTRQAALIVMLHAPEGATIKEIVAATGWQSHTVRGALKKGLGLAVTSERIAGCAGGSTGCRRPEPAKTWARPIGAAGFRWAAGHPASERVRRADRAARRRSSSGRHGPPQQPQARSSRASRAFALDTCHAPPRRVWIPRRVSTAAIARRDACPTARMSAITASRSLAK